jgi:hypothetical protein
MPRRASASHRPGSALAIRPVATDIKDAPEGDHHTLVRVVEGKMESLALMGDAALAFEETRGPGDLLGAQCVSVHVVNIANVSDG